MKNALETAIQLLEQCLELLKVIAKKDEEQPVAIYYGIQEVGQPESPGVITTTFIDEEDDETCWYTGEDND